MPCTSTRARRRHVTFGCGLALAVAATLLVPSALRAQAADSASRSNTLVRGWLGLGYGTVSHDPYVTDVGFLTGSFRVAGRSPMLRPVFLLDIGAALKDVAVPISPSATFTCGEQCAHLMVSVSVGAEFQPVARGPYLIGAVGFTGEKLIAGDENVQIEADGARGFTYVAGVAYDLSIGKRALAPFAQLFITPKFDVDESRGGAAMTRLVFGLALSSRP